MPLSSVKPGPSHFLLCRFGGHACFPGGEFTLGAFTSSLEQSTPHVSLETGLDGKRHPVCPMLGTGWDSEL